MKKRRALALLLALSLAVGTNGMTVLATEGDMPSASITIEETGGETVESENPADDQQTGESVEDGESNGENQGEIPGGEDNSDEGSGQDSGDDAENPDAGGDDVLGGVEDTPSPDDEINSEEPAETEEEPEADGEVSDDEVPEVKMVTFTDDVGFKITYNAIAVEEYQLTINGGVLNGIKDGSGNNVEGVVVLPEDKGITAIGSAFAGNENITYVKLPKGVTSIQDGAFKNCNKLQGIYLPADMQTIGASAFEQCRSLVKISIPKSVTAIRNKAFYQDEKLFMVYMKDADYSSLESIGDEAFYECKALTEFCSDTAFIIPGKLQTIGARAFYKCQSINEVNFNESVSSLGESAFENCTSLKTVALSSLLETIPKAAFKGCNNLVRVIFKAGNKTIGESAFESCIKLGGIELAYSINKIDNYAFRGCTRLMSVEIPNGEVTIGDSVFPNVATLTLIGINGSNVEKYTQDKAIKFAGYKDQSGYYQYTVLPTGTGSGTLTVKDKDGKDPNTLNSKKGVAYNTKLFVYYTPASGSALVSGSVKCNGVPMAKDSNGVYYFTMPIGGALITAEFTTISSSKQTQGTDGDIKVEVSNGDVTTEKGEVKEVSLKIGQYSRMFLIDQKDDNKAIDSSKITYTTDNKAVATVADNGMIQAVKAGSAKIRATVKGGDGVTITREIRVVVTASDVAELKVKATAYDASLIQLRTSAADGVQTATVDKNAVKQALTFKIKATAYDADEDDMSVALKWSTSDAKVAKLSSTSTTAASPINTVTIPANTDGEATITVTATNADKKTITQKFIVSVKDYTPRLVSNSLTINPNLEDGAVLEIVSAYAKAIDNGSVKLMYSDNSTESNDFSCTLLEDQSDDTVSRFRVSALAGVANKTYNVNVDINSGTYSIPLKITVKATLPSPKVAFAKNQKKLNLFKKNDGTKVEVVVSNLGNNAVSEYSLEPLSDSDDDKLFTENFKVDDWDGSHCTIIQQSDAIKFTRKNKAAVTGYLVLKYEGYKDTITKKFKITIPTQTVEDSYKLDRTADTYYVDCDAQEITLQILDKKNKNAKVNLKDGHYSVRVGTGSGFTTSVKSGDCVITDDGAIKLTMSKNPEKGKVYLELTNNTWANDKKFTYTYTIKTTSSTPKISLKSSTVTLNSRYQEQEAVFELKSNLKDTDIADEQEFVMPAKLNAKTQAEYKKLNVTYEDGVGTVSIDPDAPTIANGTYSFVCNNVGYMYKNGRMNANKVTLKVKVTNGVPTVTAKGTPSFNTRAADEADKNVEEAELTFTIKNLPKDYVFDEEATLGSIECTTKNRDGYEKFFDWKLDPENKKLKVSMENWCEAGTYKFKIKPTFIYNGDEASESPNTVSANAISFNVKVYSGSISVTLASKGKLNLLDRSGECTTANSIVYTPTFKNLKDTVADAKIYDASNGVPNSDSAESEFFDVTVSPTDGKLYVTPKQDVLLDNNKTYKVMIWVKPKNYTNGSPDGGMLYNKVLSIKTAQILPKVAADKSTVNLYLSNKEYEATFIVDKKDAKAIGLIESIAFGDKDTKAQESFVTTNDPNTGKDILIKSEPQKDGSLKVTLKLKDTVSYACNSTNKITMYVKFKGQGSNTAGTAITMNVKINK